MFKDNSLIPSEAVRLAALGSLWQAPKRYADLATEIRHFTGRIVGPSLELLGPSLEVLRLEGLIALPSGGPADPDSTMILTDRGGEELLRLLRAGLRGPMGELNKLVIALKMRFLGALPEGERKTQVELMAEIYRQELTRLVDLRQHHEAEPGHLRDWLDHDIQQIERRLDWFAALSARI